MRIALDAMGGDHAPGEIVRGAVLAVRQQRADDLHVVLVGQEAVVARELQAATGDAAAELPITVVHAPDVIAMDAQAAHAARRQRQSSVHVGLRLVRDGEADAFLSAGNSGATMATAVLMLRPLPGVDRPATGAVIPLSSGPLLVVDVGTTADCQPRHLVDFAYLGAAYMEIVHGLQRPRVGLLSNGEEANKGNRLVQETYPLLAASGLHFIGNVEGRQATAGAADVVVCDGFAGNVLLKVAEGVADLIFGLVRDAVRSRLHYKLAGLVLRPALRRAARRLDYREHGSAPLLGVRGLVFIAHGRSDATAIVSGLRSAHAAAQHGLLDHLTTQLATRPPRTTSTTAEPTP